MQKKALRVRFWFSVSLALGASLLSFNPAAWAADDAEARMKAVIEATSIESEGLLPWHLKLDVQTTGPSVATGATDGGGEKGTVEEWWASSTMYRIVYDFPSYKAVTGHNAAGAFRSADFKQVPVQVELARRQVVHPMPTAVELFDYKVDLRKNDFGTGELDCLVVSRPVLHNPFPRFGEFPAYCFKDKTNELTLSLGFGREFIPRTTPGIFQKKAIVTAMVAKQNGRPAVAARVDKLETLPAARAEDYAAPEGAEMVAEPALIPVSVSAKQTIHKQIPSVPDMVAAQLVGQEYVARVLVDREGKVAWVMPVSASLPVLIRPGETAVRQYTFKPFMVDGKAVEVLTTVTIAY